MQEKDNDRLAPQPRLHGKFTAFGITFGQGLNAVPKHEQICDEHGDVGQLMAIDGNASGFIGVGGFVSQCVAHGGTGDSGCVWTCEWLVSNVSIKRGKEEEREDLKISEIKGAKWVSK